MQLLYEDDCLVAVNKPAGVLSQPTPSQPSSILSDVAAMGIELCGGDDPSRKGLVHRLDRDTSGVLLLAKSEESYLHLQNSFRIREVDKRYNFLATGKIKRMEFTCREPLGRHPKKRTTRMVDPLGRDAETRFKLLELLTSPCSFWQAKPVTGRTHQVRVHCQSLGISILGDPLYSDKNSLKSSGITSKRTMLHCHTMTFPHPQSGDSLSLTAPYPDDFSEALELLRKKG